MHDEQESNLKNTYWLLRTNIKDTIAFTQMAMKKLLWSISHPQVFCYSISAKLGIKKFLESTRNPWNLPEVPRTNHHIVWLKLDLK